MPEDELNPEDAIREVEAELAANDISKFASKDENQLAIMVRQEGLMNKLSTVDIKKLNPTDACVIMNALDYWTEHSLGGWNKENVWVNIKCAFQLGFVMGKEESSGG